MNSVLVIGGSGLLGQHLLAESGARGFDAKGTYAGAPVPGFVPLDLATPSAAVELLQRRRPKTVLLAAAMTGVDACESDPDRARVVNSEAPAAIAKACATLGTRLVFFSTDYVFDGLQDPSEENAEPHPLGVYGHTKLTGERQVLATDPRNLVIRTSANFGWNRLRRTENSVTWILNRLRRGEAVSLFVDQRVSPSYAPGAARATFDLLDREAAGIFHVATRSCLVRFEMGRMVCEVFRLPEDLLKPARLEEAKLKARRPLRSCLAVGKVEQYLDLRPTTFREALEDMRDHE